MQRVQCVPCGNDSDRLCASEIIVVITITVAAAVTAIATRTITNMRPKFRDFATDRALLCIPFRGRLRSAFTLRRFGTFLGSAFGFALRYCHWDQVNYSLPDLVEKNHNPPSRPIL